MRVHFRLGWGISRFSVCVRAVSGRLRAVASRPCFSADVALERDELGVEQVNCEPQVSSLACSCFRDWKRWTVVRFVGDCEKLRVHLTHCFTDGCCWYSILLLISLFLHPGAECIIQLLCDAYHSEKRDHSHCIFMDVCVLVGVPSIILTACLDFWCQRDVWLDSEVVANMRKIVPTLSLFRVFEGATFFHFTERNAECCVFLVSH